MKFFLESNNIIQGKILNDILIIKKFWYYSQILERNFSLWAK